jgi:hypothetical protein
MNTTNVSSTLYPLFRALATQQVRYVVTGSVAAHLYGVAGIQPGDLDIVPHVHRKNLTRLLAALTDLDATTGPGGGTWITDERGEWKWSALDVMDEAPATWRWEPNTQEWQTFDRVFETAYGRLDVVPQIAGTYAELVQRAESMAIMDVTIKVASLEDLLARLTVPRREKDVSRVRQLRALQFERARDRR